MFQDKKIQIKTYFQTFSRSSTQYHGSITFTWFLASHNKTIWNTIKLNDLDSIILDNPFSPNLQASGSRYQLRKILTEINKFTPLQENTPNSDGRQRRRTIWTEFRLISDGNKKSEVVGIPSANSDEFPRKQSTNFRRHSD